MFKTKYRIATDAYAGYEVQFRYWWMPFYVMWNCNTYSSLERAKNKIERIKQESKVVYYD